MYVEETSQGSSLHKGCEVYCERRSATVGQAQMKLSLRSRSFSLILSRGSHLENLKGKLINQAFKKITLPNEE